MTYLSGDIIGAIFFSMLADFVGRKKVYLGTLYVSTIIGSCAFLIGPIVMGVIALIEGIMYLTKDDAEFQATYVAGDKAWF